MCYQRARMKKPPRKNIMEDKIVGSLHTRFCTCCKMLFMVEDTLEKEIEGVNWVMCKACATKWDDARRMNQLIDKHL